MKDRIVFFVLGAVLATIAYSAGDMNQATGQSGTKEFDGDVSIKGHLHVEGVIVVGDISKSPTNTITLIADAPDGSGDSNPTIMLSYQLDRMSKEYASHATISAGRNAFGVPNAFIILENEKGNIVDLSARDGYKKR